MNFENLSIKLIKTNNYDELSKKAAEIISNEINKKPTGTFGFATGSTPIGTYKELIQLYNAGKVDFSKITTFNLDEYCPINKDNEQSYIFFMKDNLFKHVNIDFDKTNIPDGETKDAAKECTNYENKIKNASGIDLQILGIGLNGHIGFNEPSEVFSKETQIVALTQSTINANKVFFASEDEMPKKAITMGIKTIMQARKIILLVNGEKKANILKEILTGTITPKVPASVLQLHQDVTVIADESALKNL